MHIDTGEASEAMLQQGDTWNLWSRVSVPLLNIFFCKIFVIKFWICYAILFLICKTYNGRKKFPYGGINAQ